MNDGAPPAEILPDEELIVARTGVESHPVVPSARWDLSGIIAAVVGGGLPLLAELFDHGLHSSYHGHLLSLTTVGFCLFAVALTASVQCAQDAANRRWLMVTISAMLPGLLIGLAFEDPNNKAGDFAYSLVITAICMTALSIMVAWWPTSSRAGSSMNRRSR